MEEGLEAIYGKEDMDFSKLDRDQSRLTRLLTRLIIGLGVIAVIAWSGFFVFINYVHPAREETFSLQIVMEETLISGQETTIEIKYANPTTVPIAALSIDLNLPSSFTITDMNKNPTDAEGLIWDLGGLTGLSDDHLVLTGIWTAQVPSETPVQAYANYKPGNFNAEFEDIDVVYVTTVESLLNLSVSGPEELSPGETGAYAITLHNEGTRTFENIEITLSLPNGFYLESSDPTLEAGTAPEWIISSLESGAQSVMLFTGSFAADVEGFQYFDTEASIDIQGRSLTQAGAQNYTDVLPSNVSVSLAANGATDVADIDQESTLRVSLGLAQSDDEAIEDYTVLLSFEGGDRFPIDWSGANLDGGTLTSEGVVWNAEDIGTLEPGVKELLNLTFPIETVDAGEEDTFKLTSIVTTASGQVRSSPVTINVNSEASLSSAVRYYDDEGQVLGNGPLPPTVGETTHYRVYWTIENDLHGLQDVRVSTTLPPHVTWQDKTNVDLGVISYDAASNTVSWKISELSTAITHLESYFTVSITPDGDDVGSFVKLTSGSDLIATDKETTAQLHRSQDGLTTEAPDDEFAADQGVVIE